MKIQSLPFALMPRWRDNHRFARGQSIVEFSLTLPVMLFLVIAIGDFGRIYTSAVAVEAAGREAADYGAFVGSNWTSTNAATTVELMNERGCISAAGSHLEGYVEGPLTAGGHRTCTNPTFTCTLELGASSADCATSGGVVAGNDCSLATTDPPCTVHVQSDYDFTMIINFPPLPSTFHIRRDSRFRISDLTPP